MVNFIQGHKGLLELPLISKKNSLGDCSSGGKRGDAGI